MSGKYTLLENLEKLRQAGTITEEEFQREKEKILNDEIPEADLNNGLGMAENNYLMLMHLSQFANFIIPLGGLAAPIVMWAINKDKNENVDKHGKNILNFIISWTIYMIVAVFLIFVLIGIPLLIAMLIVEIVFIIMAAVKASKGEYWEYPLSIPFFKIY